MCAPKKERRSFEVEIFVASEALWEAIDYMLQNCTEEAEIRYDGLKYFTVSAIY